MTLREQLQAIRERADAATPGPWAHDGALVFAHWPGTACPSITDPGDATESDLSFIADARTTVPRLVRALDYAADALTWVRTERDRDEARDAVARILAGEES